MVVLSVCPPQIPAEVEKCQDKVECFNADLKADWERWQRNKRQDFKQLLTGMADKNISHYEKVYRRDSQGNIEPHLKKTKVCALLFHV